MSKFVLALALFSTVSAHMQMKWPYPLHSTFNPETPEANKDYSQTAPLVTDGSGFPCKGYINNPAGSPLMDSVANMQAGSTFTTQFAGTATHRGGSCQWSMSYDEGATWTVVHTQMGGCMTDSLSIDVPIPSSAPSGEALFGWTWFNTAGNREMYMNCAVVTVTGGGSGLSGPSPFVANAGVNQCATIEGIDTVFPNPGDSVSYGGSYASTKPTTAAGFTGSNCVAPGASSNSGSGSGPASSVVVEASSSAAATSTTATAVSSSSATSEAYATETESAASSTSEAGSSSSSLQAGATSTSSSSQAGATSTSSSSQNVSTTTSDAASSTSSASAEAAEASSSSTANAVPSSTSAAAAGSTSTGRVCRIKKRAISLSERRLHPGQKLVNRRRAISEHRRSRLGRLGHVGH